jgi:hypothetical protein
MQELVIKSMMDIVLPVLSDVFPMMSDLLPLDPTLLNVKLETLLTNTFRGSSTINPYIPIIVTALTVDGSITTYF